MISSNKELLIIILGATISCAFYYLGVYWRIKEEENRFGKEIEKVLENENYWSLPIYRYSYLERGKYAKNLTLRGYPSIIGTVILERLIDLILIAPFVIIFYKPFSDILSTTIFWPSK